MNDPDALPKLIFSKIINTEGWIKGLPLCLSIGMMAVTLLIEFVIGKQTCLYYCKNNSSLKLIISNKRTI